jgi:hypothetical protein
MKKMGYSNDEIKNELNNIYPGMNNWDKQAKDFVDKQPSQEPQKSEQPETISNIKRKIIDVDGDEFNQYNNPEKFYPDDDTVNEYIKHKYGSDTEWNNLGSDVQDETIDSLINDMYRSTKHDWRGPNPQLSEDNNEKQDNSHSEKDDAFYK